MWYYFLMNLPKDPETMTDRFRNFMLEYKDKVVVDKYVNLVAKQQVNITVSPKRPVALPMRGYFVDRAQIYRESLAAAELMKIDPAQLYEEFKQLAERFFAMYG